MSNYLEKEDEIKELQKLLKQEEQEELDPDYCQYATLKWRKKRMKDKTYNCKDCGKECRAKAYTPEVVALGLCPQCYTNKATMTEKVNIVKIGEQINLKELGHNYLEYVRFESYENSTDREIRQSPYSWVAQTNSEYSHRTVFPMRTSTYVKFFKTLKGAKRNFIKSYIEKR